MAGHSPTMSSINDDQRADGAGNGKLLGQKKCCKEYSPQHCASGLNYPAMPEWHQQEARIADNRKHWTAKDRR